MTGKYDVNGKFRTDGAGKRNDSQLPNQPEILPPSYQKEWKARPAEEIAVPEPVLRHRRTLFGGSYVDMDDYRWQLRSAEETTKAVTSLIRTKTEKEKAFTEYERVLAEREHMPLLIEGDRLSMGIKVARVRSEFQQTLKQIDRQEHQTEQDIINDGRLRELEALEYETELARKRQVLADEKAKAAQAEELAALKAQAEKARAEAELEKERRKTEQAKRSRIDGDVSDLDEDDPHEFECAMAIERKRQDIARAAAKREAIVLARANGDESLLTEDELDELEGIRQAKERAQRNVDETNALGAIFPHEGEDGTK